MGRTLQSELDRIGGNIMAHLADVAAEKQNSQELENDTYCKNCGKDCAGYWDVHLQDGLCKTCFESEV